MAKRFTCINVGEMHLDGRQFTSSDGVANCHAGVRIGGGIYYQRPHAPARPLDPIHDRSLAVRLEGLYLEPQFAPQLFERTVDVAQTGASVNLGLSLAQQIQVRAVNYQHRGKRLTSAAS